MDWIVSATLKTILAFTGILIFARILGKEQMSQLTIYDYITGITFGDLAATIALDETAKVGQHFYILAFFAFLAFALGYIAERNRPLRKLIEGEPAVVIHNGKILEDNMRRMNYSMDNLLTQLRGKDIFDIADVEFAIIENNGAMSVLKKSQVRPVTPQDLELETEYEGVPTELIVDGQVIYQNLGQLNLDEQWLITELQKRGINSVQDIIYASLDASGQLYIDQRQDNLTYPLDLDDVEKKS